MNSVVDEIDEHSCKLRLRSAHGGVVKPHIRELDVVPAVEQIDLLFQQPIQINLDRLLGVELGERGELVGGVGQQVDLPEHLLGDLVEPVGPDWIPVLLQAYKPLDLKLDRGERILDLVRYLTGHRRPRLVPLGLCQFLCGVVQVVNHQVVGSDKTRDLIVPLIYDIFKIVDAGLVHLASHLRERLEHLVHGRGRDEPGEQQQDHKYRDHGERVQHGL